MVPLRIVIITKTDPLKKSLPNFAQPGALWGGDGDEGGSREGDQGEPVQHHRRELPVVLHPVVLLTFL